jgi:hypothetical protein
MALNPLGRKLDKNGNPIVGKKELEASGLSLRDFLNKERKLKRADGSDREPVHVDAEAGMTRGTNDYVKSGKKSFDTETEFVPKGVDLERGMGRGSRVAYESQKAEQDAGVTPAKVRNLAKSFDIPVDRKDEAGNPYKKGGSVKGWGIARGARKAKTY